jgi:hypothetical protein
VLVAGINAMLALSVAPVAAKWLHEPRGEEIGRPFASAGSQLSSLLKSKAFLWATAFTILVYFAPGFGTVMFYRQKQEFLFTDQTIGFLRSAYPIGAVLSAVLYLAICRRIELRPLLIVGLLTNALANFLMLLYSKDVTADFLIEGANGLFSTISAIALLDLVSRSIPRGSEAFGISLILSLEWFASHFGDVVGSYLRDRGVTFAELVWINSITTGSVLLLLKFIPLALLRAKDGQAETVTVEADPHSVDS